MIIVNEREVIIMKINFGNEILGTPIENIPVGETFFAQRKSAKEERSLYMKIDGKSGLVVNKFGYNYAINLESGQLREFKSDIYVDGVLAEVNFPKK